MEVNFENLSVKMDMFLPQYKPNRDLVEFKDCVYRIDDGKVLKTIKIYASNGFHVITKTIKIYQNFG